MRLAAGCRGRVVALGMGGLRLLRADSERVTPGGGLTFSRLRLLRADIE